MTGSIGSRQQDAVEELNQLLVGVQGQDGGDVLVRSDDDHAPGPVDSSRVEDAGGFVPSRGKDLLVVHQAELPFSGSQKGRDLIRGYVTVTLLYHCSYIDHAVGVCTIWSVPIHRRVGRIIEEAAQPAEARSRVPWVPFVCKDVDPPASVGFGLVPQFEGASIR